ncbi:hypothetical protein JM79_2729 [Gramella sp. Hel_I_59]|uniref:hypothetical protein n=1 Tax=Gramella sp. Hel_I_59 TaxID=1249978 RepID=UPI001151CDEA|nr:hypothetical protein [Gramella sp. Hel_I_59]TQI71781.1 hypothetical protein JM79_2729 [Gramella sp. Hel_I_59]
MNDLEIIEYLLEHPDLKDQVLVSDNEIGAQFKEGFKTDTALMRKVAGEINEKFDRSTTRVHDEIFIERLSNKKSLAQRNAYHFKNLTEAR